MADCKQCSDGMTVRVLLDHINCDWSIARQQKLKIVDPRRLVIISRAKLFEVLISLLGKYSHRIVFILASLEHLHC